MRKNILFIIIVLFFSLKLQAQVQSTEGNISVNAVVANESIPAEAVKNLLIKMKTALTYSGMADFGYMERFVMTARVDIIQKDIVATTPARISQKMEITFFVGDAVENKLYESYTLELTGIGTNEVKAFISAFQKINPKSAELQEMLAKARTGITVYFTNHWKDILTHANTLATTGNYDEAIYQLMMVPNVCGSCYEQSQKVAAELYIKRATNLNAQLLKNAQNEWMKNPSQEGAITVADILADIDTQLPSYAEAQKLRNIISSKLKADERREWDFNMKQYQDNQQHKSDIINACREVGGAWARNQPTTITRNIFRSW